MPDTVRRRSIPALGVLATLFLMSSAHAVGNRLGRAWGCGYSDGYHACRRAACGHPGGPMPDAADVMAVRRLASRPVVDGGSVRGRPGTACDDAAGCTAGLGCDGFAGCSAGDHWNDRRGFRRIAAGQSLATPAIVDRAAATMPGHAAGGKFKPATIDAPVTQGAAASVATRPRRLPPP